MQGVSGHPMKLTGCRPWQWQQVGSVSVGFAESLVRWGLPHFTHLGLLVQNFELW